MYWDTKYAVELLLLGECASFIRVRGRCILGTSRWRRSRNFA